MDPWNEDKCDASNDKCQNFEDDFHPCFRLPDSEEYLSKLERRLANLQEKRSKKDLVNSLEEKHKSCMEQLLLHNPESISREEEDVLDSSCPPNVILRHIAPERHAVTVGENVKLLDADHLAKNLSSDTSAEKQAEH